MRCIRWLIICRQMPHQKSTTNGVIRHILSSHDTFMAIWVSPPTLQLVAWGWNTLLSATKFRSSWQHRSVDWLTFVGVDNTLCHWWTLGWWHLNLASAEHFPKPTIRVNELPIPSSLGCNTLASTARVSFTGWLFLNTEKEKKYAQLYQLLGGCSDFFYDGVEKNK